MKEWRVEFNGILMVNAATANSAEDAAASALDGVISDPTSCIFIKAHPHESGEIIKLRAALADADKDRRYTHLYDPREESDKLKLRALLDDSLGPYISTKGAEE